MLKSFLKKLLYFLLSIIGFILVYLLIVFCCSRIELNSAWHPGKDITIYLLSNGVHSDLVVPVKTPLIDWSKIVKYKNTTGNDTTEDWVAFGWGDKGFYLQTPTWADLKFSVAFR